MPRPSKKPHPFRAGDCPAETQPKQTAPDFPVKGGPNPANAEATCSVSPTSDSIIPTSNRPDVPVPESPPAPIAELTPAPVAIPLSTWRPACGVAVTGLSHSRKGLPCQDAVAWRSDSRPILALSDGAGSAAVSERGATALVSGVSRFLVSLEDDLSPWLDDPAKQAPEQTMRWVRRLLVHACGILDDLARSERRDVRDLRATLLVAVVGSVRTFWWQVGDGAIVVRQGDALHALGDASKAKGEFANQTCFVDAATISEVQFGLLPTAEVSGIALMSDGGAERLVASDGSRVAARIREWFEAAASERLTRDKIVLAFHDPAMWERTSLDDRSIVLAARTGSENYRVDGYDKALLEIDTRGHEQQIATDHSF